MSHGWQFCAILVRNMPHIGACANAVLLTYYLIFRWNEQLPDETMSTTLCGFLVRGGFHRRRLGREVEAQTRLVVIPALPQLLLHAVRLCDQSMVLRFALLEQHSTLFYHALLRLIIFDGVEGRPGSRLRRVRSVLRRFWKWLCAGLSRESRTLRFIVQLVFLKISEVVDTRLSNSPVETVFADITMIAGIFINRVADVTVR